MKLLLNATVKTPSSKKMLHGESMGESYALGVFHKTLGGVHIAREAQVGSAEELLVLFLAEIEASDGSVLEQVAVIDKTEEGDGDSSSDPHRLEYNFLTEELSAIFTTEDEFPEDAGYRLTPEESELLRLFREVRL